MKKLKNFLLIGTIVLGISSLSAYAASTYKTPAEAVAGLTGRTLDSVVKERANTGKSYGTIANEAGVLEEYQEEILDQKKDVLEKKVADGTITQKNADRLLESMEENQVYCDGLGYCGNGLNGYNCIDDDGDGICDNYGTGYGAVYGRCGGGNGYRQGRGRCGGGWS